MEDLAQALGDEQQAPFITGHSSYQPSEQVKVEQQPTESSKQPIRVRYFGHVTGSQPIGDQYYLIRSIPEVET